MSPQVLRRLALALVVALIAWGALYLSGRRKPDNQAGLALPRMTAAEVSEIAFRKAADTILLTRQGGVWLVNGFPANGKGAEGFLAMAGDSSVKSEVVAQSPGSHQRLGVDSVTARRLTIVAAGKPILDLWIGNRGPDFEGFYVRPSGQDVTYLLRGQFAELFALSLPEWREKQIAAIPLDSIGTVEVSRGKRRWTLNRDGSGWRLGGAAADSTKVTRYLAQFGVFRATGFPEPAELDSIHFELPDRTLTLTTPAGRQLLALVFDSTHAGSFWTRSAPGGPVYRLDARSTELATPADSTLTPTPSTSPSSSVPLPHS